MDIERTYVLLFSIATAVAIAVRHLRVPYTLALVLVGLARLDAGEFTKPDELLVSSLPQR